MERGGASRGDRADGWTQGRRGCTGTSRRKPCRNLEQQLSAPQRRRPTSTRALGPSLRPMRRGMERRSSPKASVESASSGGTTSSLQRAGQGSAGVGLSGAVRRRAVDSKDSSERLCPAHGLAWLGHCSSAQQWGGDGLLRGRPLPQRLPPPRRPLGASRGPGHGRRAAPRRPLGVAHRGSGTPSR